MPNVIAVNSTIWKKIETGNYTIVFALVEVFLQYIFILLFYTLQNKCGIFTKYLVYIRIDKAYLIWDLRIF